MFAGFILSDNFLPKISTDSAEVAAAQIVERESFTSNVKADFMSQSRPTLTSKGRRKARSPTKRKDVMGLELGLKGSRRCHSNQDSSCAPSSSTADTSSRSKSIQEPESAESLVKK